MFIIGYFLIAVAKIISLLINIYILLVILDAILTWFPSLHNNPLRHLLAFLVEPLLIQVRKILRIRHIDIAPFVAIVLLYFLNEFLVRVLMRLGELFL